MIYNLTDIAPNAHYDNVNGKPAVIFHDNDGSTLFRINICEEYDDDGTLVGWSCFEIRTYKKANRANIKHDLIRAILDDSAEFALVNKYNMHKLGVLKNNEAVADYKAYLQMLCDIDAVLDATF